MSSALWNQRKVCIPFILWFLNREEQKSSSFECEKPPTNKEHCLFFLQETYMKPNIPKREHWKDIAVLLMLFDAGAIFFSYFVALFLRFDFIYSSIPQEYLTKFYTLIGPYILLSICVYLYARLYKSIWRFASFNELTRLILANISCFCFLIAGTMLFKLRMPMFFYGVGIVLQTIFTTGIRFSYRFYLLLKNDKGKSGKSEKKSDQKSRVMIVGAGQAGQVVLRDILGSEHLHDKVICMVDDNKNKWNRYVEGVPVMGGTDQIPEIVEEKNINKIYFAIPTASPVRKK